MKLLPLFQCRGCGRWLIAEQKDVEWNQTPDRPANVRCPFCNVVETITAAHAASWRDKVFIPNEKKQGAVSRPTEATNTQMAASGQS